MPRHRQADRVAPDRELLPGTSELMPDEEFMRRLDAARDKILRQTPCVWCRQPAGIHLAEELERHLDWDRDLEELLRNG